MNINLSHCPLPTESTPSEPLDFNSLVNSNPIAEPVLYPAGLSLNLESDGRLDDEQQWSMLMHGALKALFSLVAARIIAEKVPTRTELLLRGLSKKGAIVSVQTVSFVRCSYARSRSAMEALP